uniref:FMRFamide-12 n=1 Tax=Sarcophaga bullata TaxID=7385 RepID=FAR12_SARBU|nr:RecName: Full=FMRFamide-12; AltName: Full=SabFMRFamide-12 [Sarcophaga bullata]
SAPSQDFMRF